MVGLIWRLAEAPAEEMEGELRAWPHPLRQLLYNRGLRTADDVERFLCPETVGMHQPFLLRGMDAAVERIYRALREEQLIGIYGDFDVDGLTATALLAEVLESPSLQGRVVTYVPHRTREGYGLNPEAVHRLGEMGVRLLITADCGIGSDEEVRLAARLRMDVIITDHHRVPERVPPAFAVVNPRQAECGYPFQELAGVGVAWKLAEGLMARLWGVEEARRRLEPQLDLVALGTVADLAPLRGENRLLVKLGLRRMNEGDRLGLRALIRAAGFERVIDADSIAYGLAPRLNAAGRMGDARRSLELLLTRSEEEAAQLASELDAANRERQAATALALDAARKDLSVRVELPPALVLAGDYPSGVVGLVAGKLAEEFHRPAFVIEWGEKESRGSGRGVPGFDVVGALAESTDLLLRFGGHAQAGGFSVATSQLGELTRRLEGVVLAQLGEVPPRLELRLEAPLRARQVAPAIYEMLSVLEPFGCGNEHPLFYTAGALVRDCRIVGSGHLKLWLADESGPAAAIGFGMATDQYAFIRPGMRVDCAYRIGQNRYGGTIGYEMVLKDVRPAVRWRGAQDGRS